MNSNLFRTLMYAASAAALLLPIFLGCTALPTDSFDCSTSWLPPHVSGVTAIGLMVLALVVKKFGGAGMFTTTSTGFRTMLTIGSILVTGAVVFLGCSTVGTSIDCSNSWIGPMWGGLAASALLGLNLIVKKFDGTTLTQA